MTRGYKSAIVAKATVSDKREAILRAAVKVFAREYLPAEKLPTFLLVLMPSRILNINVMMFPALLLGLLGAYCVRPAAQLIAF